MDIRIYKIENRIKTTLEEVIKANIHKGGGTRNRKSLNFPTRILALKNEEITK